MGAAAVARRGSGSDRPGGLAGLTCRSSGRGGTQGARPPPAAAARRASAPAPPPRQQRYWRRRAPLSPARLSWAPHPVARLLSQQRRARRRAGCRSNRWRPPLLRECARVERCVGGRAPTGPAQSDIRAVRRTPTPPPPPSMQPRLDCPQEASVVQMAWESEWGGRGLRGNRLSRPLRAPDLPTR